MSENFERGQHESSSPKDLPDISSVCNDPELLERFESEREDCREYYKSEAQACMRESSDARGELLQECKTNNIISLIKSNTTLESFRDLPDEYEAFIQLMSVGEANGGLPEKTISDLRVIIEYDNEPQNNFLEENLIWGPIVDKQGADDLIKEFKGMALEENIFGEKLNEIMSIGNKNDIDSFLSVYGDFVDFDEVEIENREVEIENREVEIDLQIIKNAEQINPIISESIDTFPEDIKGDLEKLIQIDLETADNRNEYRELAQKIVEKLLESEDLLEQVYNSLPTEKRADFFEGLAGIVRLTDSHSANRLMSSFNRLEVRNNPRANLSNTISTNLDDSVRQTRSGEFMMGSKNGPYEIPLNLDRETARILQNPINALSNQQRAEFTNRSIELTTKLNGLYETKQILLEIYELQNSDHNNDSKIAYLQSRLPAEYQNLDNISQSISMIDTAIENKESEIQNLREQFENHILTQAQTAIDRAREAQEKADDIRDFLDRSGFSVFPNNVMDEVLIHVNKNKGSINGVNISSDIDISNGQFGGGVSDGETKSREIFLQVFNKMISGDPSEPITNITKVAQGSQSSFPDMSIFINKLQNDYDIDPTKGSVVIAKLLDNLGKDENPEEDNE